MRGVGSCGEVNYFHERAENTRENTLLDRENGPLIRLSAPSALKFGWVGRQKGTRRLKRPFDGRFCRPWARPAREVKCSAAYSSPRNQAW